MCPRAQRTLPLPVALRAARLRRRELPGAAARRARHLPRHHHLPLDAAHRLLERDRQRRVEIGAAPAAAVGRRHRVQHLGEQLGERRRLRPVRRDREIEPVNSNVARRRPAPARRPSS